MFRVSLVFAVMLVLVASAPLHKSTHEKRSYGLTQLTSEMSAAKAPTNSENQLHSLTSVVEETTAENLTGAVEATTSENLTGVVEETTPVSIVNVVEETSTITFVPAINGEPVISLTTEETTTVKSDISSLNLAEILKNII
jgi:hypothetical protein